MKTKLFLIILMTWVFTLPKANACTGITLQTQSNQPITARTIEWAAQPLTTMYVLMPRGKMQYSILPDGTNNGKQFVANYGYVGIAVEDDAFVMEGINEVGLGAGLFYFPQYGEYMPYKEEDNSMCVSDMQFVAWVLSTCATIDEMIALLPTIRVIGIDPRASTVHWRVTEPSGRQVVVEIINQEVKVHENPLGVLTNSPELTWHITNLNNYVNLRPGSAADYQLNKDIQLMPLGHGSGMLGLPGDFTAPSRFVRAAFYVSTSPVWKTSWDAVQQAFHILNNFDIPVGSQHVRAEIPKGLPSATQFTSATDQTAMKFYYRTAWNSNIRCIDLMDIDFKKVKYQSHPLDQVQQQPVEVVKVK